MRTHEHAHTITHVHTQCTQMHTHSIKKEGKVMLIAIWADEAESVKG